MLYPNKNFELKNQKKLQNDHFHVMLKWFKNIEFEKKQSVKLNYHFFKPELFFDSKKLSFLVLVIL